eukprot:Skav227138  [mRNA]  locus=scaffold133:488048:498218:- [translate_table: standard]
MAPKETAQSFVDTERFCFAECAPASEEPSGRTPRWAARLRRGAGNDAEDAADAAPWRSTVGLLGAFFSSFVELCRGYVAQPQIWRTSTSGMVLGKLAN